MKASYVVSFVFRNSSVRMDFMFGAFKNAEELFNKGSKALGFLCEAATPIFLDAADDFNSKAVVCMSEVCGICFNDVEQDTKKNVEMRIEGDKMYSRALQAEQRKPTLATPQANGIQV